MQFSSLADYIATCRKGPFLIFLFFFAVRFLAVRFVSIDSDEVMWSVMAHNILRYRQFYVYFITQNFRGALESYVLIPFQLLFGTDIPILRTNSILFSALNSALLYKLLKEKLHSRRSLGSEKRWVR